MTKPPIFSKPKITSEGLMNGKWQIKITGINDCDLESVEIDVLKIFGRKKNKAK